jgi:O-antigen/teichoic acid export membrane protein
VGRRNDLRGPLRGWEPDRQLSPTSLPGTPSAVRFLFSNKQASYCGFARFADRHTRRAFGMKLPGTLPRGLKRSHRGSVVTSPKGELPPGTAPVPRSGQEVRLTAGATGGRLVARFGAEQAREVDDVVTDGVRDTDGGVHILGTNGNIGSLVRNIATQYLSFGVTIVVGIVLTPTLLRGLGQDQFAAWTAALALIGYVGLGELGLGTAVVRRVAAESARGSSAVSRVASSGFAVYLAVFVVGLLAVLVCVSVVGLVLDVDGTLLAHARLVVLLLGLTTCVSFLLNTFPAILFGTGRADVLTATGVVTSLVMAAAQISVVLTTRSLLWLAVTTSICGVLGASAVWAVARRRYRDVVVRLGLADRKIALQLLGSGWRNGLISVAVAASVTSDVIIVGAMLTPAAVAAYGVAVKISAMMQNLSSQLAEVLVPSYSHYNEADEDDRTYDLFVETTVASAAIAFPAGAVLLAGGDLVLHAWLGVTPPGSAAVLFVLVLNVMLAVAGNTSYPLLSGMDELGFMVRLGLVTAVVNVVLGIVLTARFGLTGPAVATVLVTLVSDVVLLPRFVVHRLGRGLGQFWKQTGSSVALPGSIALGCALGVRYWSAGMPDLAAIALLALSSGASFAIVFSLTMGSRRRSRYASVGLLLLRRGH